MSEFPSPIKSREVANSMGKLQKAASESRFRIKSFRMKTSENEKMAIINLDKDYEAELLQKGYTRQFLKTLYVTRSQSGQLKISESKYIAFIRSLHQKIIDVNTLQLYTMNLQKIASQIFLKQFTRINKDITCLDFSLCTFFSQMQPYTFPLILESIFNNPKIVKVKLKNMCLKQEEINEIFVRVNESEKIFSIDIGNESSQSMNRISDNLDILFDFFKNNQTTAIVNLENLSVKKIGVENIQKGITANPFNPLKILSLKNNAITDNASLHFTMLARSGLISLDLSQNPLGPGFYLNISSLRASTLRNLDLSMTNMNSQSLIFFFDKLQENKSLQVLKLDKNNFSNNWFNQMKQTLEVNNSIQNLSMMECGITRMSDAFAGLYYNRYLKKLNLSGNQFQEGVKELVELIKLNKNLTSLSMKFCGLKSDDFIKIFQSMQENQTISFFDLSENQMGDEGAKEVLKCLNTNSTLNFFLFDKVQIQLRLKKEIEEKIKSNRAMKKTIQMERLKKQNKNIKEQDYYTWDDVERLDQKVRTNMNNIRILQSNVANFEKKFDQKKHKNHQIMQQYSNRQSNLKSQIDQLEKKLKQIEEEEFETIRRFQQKEQFIIQSKKREEETINDLWQRIQMETEKNQKRENQLQDQLENQKYIKKKKEVATTKKQVVVKTGFDTTTAISSKRKSKNI